MKIAYLIMAYDQPQLFGRLVDALQHEGATLYAHIDRKHDAGPFRAVAGALPVRFIEQPVEVNWGGYSQVEAMLKLLAAAVQDGHDHYIFLSGRDYPVRPHGELRALLAQDPQRSYINFYPLAPGSDFSRLVEIYAFRDLYPHIRPKALRSLTQLLVRAANRVLPKRRFPAGFQPFRGSTSWCLSAAAAAYVVDFVRQDSSRELIKFFHSVTGADEIFFQTVLFNSPLAKHCAGYVPPGQEPPRRNENKVSLHYIDWDPARENPAVLELRDLAPIQASPKFFARKFDQARSATLLAALDQQRRDAGAAVSSGR